jgi:hypothetical protein
MTPSAHALPAPVSGTLIVRQLRQADTLSVGRDGGGEYVV